MAILKKSQVKSGLGKVATGLLASALILTTGCKNLDPYTGEEKTSNTVKYGAIGAAICGIIGARDSGQHARNAAVGCGIIGASIGAYMDNQEEKLRQSLENTGVSIKREGDQIRLIMPGNITFATNSSDIQEGFKPVLNSVVTVLREYDETIVEIEGYTDSTGSLSYNLQLSQARAQSVSNYLQVGGIITQRLVTSGKGPNNPIANNATPEGRAMNRRVEIRLRAIEARG
ncbi:OmpA family protein [Aliikangiella sp. G2MR2-5]|uniref:OmpA family protein n=1 Tax=Aliikangiella sp. G2MR2-5 TaxID=2788943 RepID=UPI0018AC8C8D|nr:OmpA family protein [Aliikangiella sp. G2MR2-5]